METQNILFAGRRVSLLIRDDVDRSVAAEIYKHKEYRRTEKVIIEAEDLIVDAGAHAGYFTIYCRVLNTDVRIISLEPEPDNFKMLVKNLTLNQINNVETVKAALAEKSGKAQLRLSDDSHNHFLVTDNYNDFEKTISVDTLSVGDILMRFKALTIDLLKMDIEGGEFDVINSLSEPDYKSIKNIFFEYHNWNGNDYRKLENILRVNGFGVEIFPSKFDKKLGFIFAKNKKFGKK